MSRWKVSLFFFGVLYVAGTVWSSAAEPAAASREREERLRGEIVSTATGYLGTRYTYGGTGKAGLDCSGFTRLVYGRHGVVLPRTSAAQYHLGKPLDPAGARPGDLLFFAVDGRGISHVGIYLGDKKFIHAPSTGKKVSVASLETGYWSLRLRGAASFLHLYKGEEK